MRPQIRQLITDEGFEATMDETELPAWHAYKDNAKDFWESIRKPSESVYCSGKLNPMLPRSRMADAMCH